MTSAVRVDNASKRFRQHRRFPGFLGSLRTLVTRQFTEIAAVDGISFDITAGEAVGYLGPNGAGKSTMLKMLTGILMPSGGTISVLGRTPHLSRTANAREIGVVFGQRSQLWWDLPLAESFTLHRHIYQIGPDRFRDRLAALTAMLGIGEFIDRPVRQLSLGQRMRGEMAMALLHEPKILFLDEPTIGLDVVTKHALRQFLATANRELGVTIVLTTHDLMDIEAICPRLIMVDAGKLLYDGPTGGLRAALGSVRRLRLEFSADPGSIALPDARIAVDEGEVKHFLLERPETSVLDVIRHIGDDVGLRDIAIVEPTIEEVIRTFYTSRAALPT